MEWTFNKREVIRADFYRLLKQIWLICAPALALLCWMALAKMSSITWPYIAICTLVAFVAAGNYLTLIALFAYGEAFGEDEDL